MDSSLGKRILLLILVALLGMANPYPVFADDNTADIEKRLNDLESQVADLKQELWKQKQEKKSQEVITGEPAMVTANAKDGFSIKSPNGDFSLKIGGYAQVEGREFGSGNKNDASASATSYDEDSAILLRRARLIFQGTVAKNFDFYLQPEFGYNNNFSTITSTSTSAYAPALQDAWIDYKYSPDFVVKAGKFKTPFDLENLQDSRYTDFVELGLTGNLSPQRDLGLQVGGNLYYDWITYAAGVFNGAADHENPYGGTATAGYEANNLSGTGRIFVTPFKDTTMAPLQKLGFGYAAEYGREKGFDLPSYVTAGQAPFFSYNSSTTSPAVAAVSADGPQYREEPQAYYYYKSFGVLAEAVESQEEVQYSPSAGHVVRTSPDNKAFDISSTYVLTGEDATYNGVTPRHDFNPASGNWGAVELAGRYSEIKLDHSIFDDGFASLNTSASKATAWGMGINWYLNKNAKVVFDYEQTKFDRGATISSGNNGNRKTENLFTTMLQLSIG